MQNNSIYALLVGVGDYNKMNIVSLSTYRMDLMLMGSAIITGLKAPEDNIRILSGADNNGFVTTTDLAKSIANFRELLKEEDTFIFYYSGHGRNRNLIFSNGQLELQSIIDFVEQLPSKNKIVILDCCYSGNFETSGAREMHFSDSVSDFAGHGIAVLASSSHDEVSRLGPNDNHSMFTGALLAAITMNKRVRKGLLSLNDINEELQEIVKVWNEQNPGKEQHPIFRSSIGGTIFFLVEEYHPYETMEFRKKTERYTIVRVEPLSSAQMKRLCAFVILKEENEKELLPQITKEIAETVKYAEIYSTEASELKFEGTPARAVWCYFGHDKSDIINHNHYAYTIWADNDDVKSTFFRPNSNAEVVDEIYVFINGSYDLVKKISEPTMSREEFIEDNKKLLATIVSMAEQFITDLQEVYNNTLTISEMQDKYSEWIQRLKKRYIRLTDGDVAPDDLHDWTEEIVTLAGWVLDMSLVIENEKGGGVVDERELWLLNHSIKKYYESLEKLKEIEQKISV